ncbi:unnamed protein product [Effrenium voratum]|nr:unnamed protein product [Effrenium voratum]
MWLNEVDASYLRGALGVGYAALIGVNYASIAGKLGATNGQISEKYTTQLTPAGFTFSIWGPIFLLQGVGTCGFLTGKWSDELVRTVFPCWFAAWACQNGWQALFVGLPLENAKPRSKVFWTQVRCGFLLLAAYISMTVTGHRLQQLDSAGMGRTALVDFPSGLNAGWLSAASGIGLSLVLEYWPSGSLVSVPRSAALLSLVCCLGAGATMAWGGSNAPGFGVGYSAAVMWACYGLTKKDTAPPGVKKAARGGMALSLLAGAASLLR